MDPLLTIVYSTIIIIPLLIVYLCLISNLETTTKKVTTTVFILSILIAWFFWGHQFATIETFSKHPLGDSLSPISYLPSACIAVFPTIICYAICKNIEDSKKEKEKENKKRQ